MKAFLIAVMIAASLATTAHAHPAGHDKPVCTEVAADEIYNFEMTGQPRLYPDQFLRREVASDRGDVLSFVTANDAQDAMWVLMRDILCGEVDPFSTPEREAREVPDDCIADKVWYGCIDWR